MIKDTIPRKTKRNDDIVITIDGVRTNDANDETRNERDLERKEK